MAIRNILTKGTKRALDEAIAVLTDEKRIQGSKQIHIQKIELI